MITFKGNYVHHSSGRSPKVAGNTLLHAVNNYFYANSKHVSTQDPQTLLQPSHNEQHN